MKIGVLIAALVLLLVVKVDWVVALVSQREPLSQMVVCFAAALGTTYLLSLGGYRYGLLVLGCCAVFAFTLAVEAVRWIYEPTRMLASAVGCFAALVLGTCGSLPRRTHR